MKIYNITKIEADGTEKDYGRYNDEKDVKAIIKGFKQDDVIPNLYTRKGSTIIYIVDEVQ